MNRLKVALATMFCALWAPVHALAEAGTTVRDEGVSALWIFANLAYMGMRAQGSTALVWRVLALICGFPLTFLTFFVVAEGGERVYGVDLPRRPKGP